MDWCLWATTTWTNNRKSVVAINLHACLLLLEGQGLWGSMPFFLQGWWSAEAEGPNQPKTWISVPEPVAFWKVDHCPLPSVPVCSHNK